MSHSTKLAPVETIRSSGEVALPVDVVRLADILETLRTVPRKLWRLEEVAESCGVDRRTIERLRSAGRFPLPDMKIGKVPLWRPETIDAWIDKGGR